MRAKWKERVPQIKEIKGKRQWVIDRNTVMGYANTSSVVRTDGVKSTAVSARPVSIPNCDWSARRFSMTR